MAENCGGTVHHTDRDQGLSKRARTHLEALGLGDIVEYHVGEAVQALREAPGSFDVIFTDIDKEGYPDSLPVTREKLRPVGVLIAANVLWGDASSTTASELRAPRGFASSCI